LGGRRRRARGYRQRAWARRRVLRIAAPALPRAFRLQPPCGYPVSPVAALKTFDAYRPTGDQPRAIETLSEGIIGRERFQTLVGATGTGKTATMAWTIERVGKPALVIAHNKTLAAQLCNEFREFFPSNAVEYFVSYYDYYQPEAY